MSPEPLGLAVLDKPAGITSHDVVAAVRRALGVRRVGHAGTLDPPATGVLLVGVGRATRLLGYLQGTDKAYDGTLELGSATTTLDATGEVTERADMTGVRADDVVAAASRLTGELDQVPPMVSAVHVGGRRLHELARSGVEVERAPRRVHVARFEVEPSAAGRWTFHVECSAGTYVRSLVDDLGRSLGGVAHVASLRRTRSGHFGLDDAVDLERFAALAAQGTAPLLAPVAMVSHLASVVVTDEQAADLVHGRRVRVERSGSGAVAALDERGDLVAVCGHTDDGLLAPTVVLRVQGSAESPE